MLNLWKFAIFGLLCLFFQHVLSQDITSARIRVESGGNVPININSLKKYNDGVVYMDWSRIAIAYSDSTVTATDTIVSTATWKLEFKANTSQLFGDYGGDMDLDLITLEVVDAGGSNELGAYIKPGPISLSENFQTLIEGAPQGNFIILITYRIGEGAKKLLGNPPDYYTVDIILDLSKWAD